VRGSLSQTVRLGRVGPGGEYAGIHVGAKLRTKRRGEYYVGVRLAAELRHRSRPKPEAVKSGTLPAVVAVTDGAPEPHVLRSQWDLLSHILIAQTEHLSLFEPILLNLSKLRQVMSIALNGYLELTPGSPIASSNKS
jgi:hypothetical protein